ncbi:MAG: NAD(P)/FAD-dependent oxidoreductase [Bacteroidaceae bacterium]|nr:NAD(P)/FAD-dependent oxidoreductase [Bacteroidaceae bacterium]
MKNNRVVIIGAGLGGLQCGYILAKNGYDVTVLEQERVVGGCLQSFARRGTLFDTGFHYVGALGEGEALNRLFTYFDLMSLPWKKLDADCFDEIVIGDKSYPYAMGHNNFYNRLVEYFPHEREGLKNYIALLKRVGDHIFDNLKLKEGEKSLSNTYFAQSAYKFLTETIQDPILRQVLSGASLKMELKADTLPLYTFAQINDSFIRSSWRLMGGGQQLVDKLAHSIERMGGSVITATAVISIVEKDGRVAGVRADNGNFYEADWVISNVHPALTVSLVEEGSMMRPIYRRRIKSLENTFGMFTANILLKKDSLPYINKNIFVHKADTDMWNVRFDRTESVLVSMPAQPDDVTYTPSIDLLSPMSWQEVVKWADKPAGRRGEDYVTFKQAKTEQCLQLIEHRLPHLRDAIEHIYTSTPLTYHNYTTTNQGCAYGIRKDYDNVIMTMLTPRTPVPGLLQTGQNLNLHGIMGVSMTSLYTCAEILGLETIRKEINI